MRLQRHVAEIFQSEDAKRIGMMQDAGHGQRHFGQQLRNGDERHRRVVDRPGVQREDDRFGVLQQHPEVAAIRGIAGQGHDLSGVRFCRETLTVVFGEVLLEAWFHQNGVATTLLSRITSDWRENSRRRAPRHHQPRRIPTDARRRQR